MPIDILFGSARLREALDADTPPVDIAAGWTSELDEFRHIRERFLLYA
jgi:hypothetical protein